jgi:hypothetical protein
VRITTCHVQRRCIGVVFPLVFSVLCPIAARSQSTTTTGEFRSAPPTLTALGFEWRVSGDDNRNARVEATYRKKGEREWRKALPLLRLQHELVSNGGPSARRNWYYTYQAPNMFAGSILNLEPGVEYSADSFSPIPTG